MNINFRKNKIKLRPYHTILIQKEKNKEIINKTIDEIKSTYEKYERREINQKRMKEIINNVYYFIKLGIEYSYK